jgi:t-SNARE syntaxin family protein
LDSVYNTVSSLRDQANVMSRELEDQSYLIEDFDRQVDTAGDKLRRGIKKVDWVIRNNGETLGSCCITMLIVVLIVLLVLVIVL